MGQTVDAHTVDCAQLFPRGENHTRRMDGTRNLECSKTLVGRGNP